MKKRLRILTWHVHGNYLYYLTQLPHDFLLVNDPSRAEHHSGRSGTLPWGDNVLDLPVERIAHTGDIDVVIFQSRGEWERVQHEILTPAQRHLPRIYIEHDPPQEHPTDTRHWVDDPNVLLVHVTHFNRLMWNSGQTPTEVIEHGVKLLGAARWRGELERGIVVVNNLRSRGRRLGLDVWEAARRKVPLSLFGMDSLSVGGEGEIENRRLPEAMAQYRFFFNPIRYTSLGLAIVEAMMVGLPIVGLATTELPTVIQDGRNGFIDTDVDKLIARMQLLLGDAGLARQLGEAARATALERFHIDRFVADWQRALLRVTG